MESLHSSLFEKITAFSSTQDTLEPTAPETNEEGEIGSDDSLILDGFPDPYPYEEFYHEEYLNEEDVIFESEERFAVELETQEEDFMQIEIKKELGNQEDLMEIEDFQEEQVPNLVASEPKRKTPRVSWEKLSIDEPFSRLEVPEPEKRSGPGDELEDMTPDELFSLFFTQDLWQIIKEQTNLYASQVLHVRREEISNHPRGRLASWKPVDRREIKKFLGLYLLMSIHSQTKYADYWSDDILLRTNFPKYMSRDRFFQILSLFHLGNNINPKAATDKLYKIREVYDYLVTKWQEYYEAGPYLSIDEGMIPYTGRLEFLQYIKKKPHKWGVKVYALCDSKTGYCLKSFIYTGEMNSKEKMTPQDVVEFLMKGYENQGKTLYVDNFYTSYALMNKLRDVGIGCTGTLNAKRVGDKNLTKKLTKGEIQFYSDQERKNVLCLWKDRKLVQMLSNCSSTSIIHKKIEQKNTVKDKTIPAIIEEYNHRARGVDLSNQFALQYRHPHSTRKWWKVIWQYLLQVTITNALIIYRRWHPSYGHKEFLLEITRYLLGEPKIRKKMKHLPNWIDPTKRSRKRLRCKNKTCKKETQWYCQSCSKNEFVCSLCLPKCWAEYHRQNNI